MICPFCHNLKTRVINSRSKQEGKEVKRRRVCSRCKGRFSTYERVYVNYLGKVFKEKVD